jgi:hypothetical protein
MNHKFVLGLISVLSLVGCSDKSEPNASVAPNAQGENVKKLDDSGKLNPEKTDDGSKGDVKMQPVDTKAPPKDGKIENPKFPQMVQGQWQDKGQDCLPQSFDNDSSAYQLNGQMISQMKFDQDHFEQEDETSQWSKKDSKKIKTGQKTIVVQGSMAQVFELKDGSQTQIGQGEIEVQHEQINAQEGKGVAKIKFPTQSDSQEAYLDQKDMYLTSASQDCLSGRIVQKFSK